MESGVCYPGSPGGQLLHWDAVYAPHTKVRKVILELFLHQSSWFCDRWLVKRGRSKEAMLVLSRINRKSIREEGVIDTCLDLEELNAKISSDNEQTYYLLLKELFKYKYR